MLGALCLPSNLAFSSSFVILKLMHIRCKASQSECRPLRRCKQWSLIIRVYFLSVWKRKGKSGGGKGRGRRERE